MLKVNPFAEAQVSAAHDAVAPKRMRWRRRPDTVESVPSIQIKNVPDDVHETVRRRASAAGQSLQEYLLAWITRDARSPTLEEILDDAAANVRGPAPEMTAAEAVRLDRDAR